MQQGSKAGKAASKANGITKAAAAKATKAAAAKSTKLPEGSKAVKAGKAGEGNKAAKAATNKAAGGPKAAVIKAAKAKALPKRKQMLENGQPAAEVDGKEAADQKPNGTSGDLVAAEGAAVEAALGGGDIKQESLDLEDGKKRPRPQREASSHFDASSEKL